jgi:hypothetical protein
MTTDIPPETPEEPSDSKPKRTLITSRAELQSAVLQTITAATRHLLCIHSDLSIFDLSRRDVTELLAKFLVARRNARARLLVDDSSWLDTSAARLRALQQRFPLALEMRVASLDDPVGDDATMIADEATVLDMRPTTQARGDLWTNNKPHAQPLVAAFNRRWEAAAHNLPVVPLGLG